MFITHVGLTGMSQQGNGLLKFSGSIYDYRTNKNTVRYDREYTAI